MKFFLILILVVLAQSQTCLEGQTAVYNIPYHNYTCIFNGYLIPNCIDNQNDYVGQSLVLLCFQCQDGYILVQSQNSCLPISDVTPNCIEVILEYQGQGQIPIIKCITCQLYYILLFEENKCIPLVQDCAHYVNQKCTICIPGLNLTFVQNQGQKCLPNITKTCPNGQKFINGTCNPISSCQLFFQQNGFYSQNCLNCSKDQILDPTGQKCLKQIICPQTKNNQTIYVIKNLVCIQISVYCQIYLDDGYCISCQQNYYSFNGSCFPIIPQKPPVITCQKDYILMGSICVKKGSPVQNLPMITQVCPCFDACVVFNRILNKCQKCATGYEPQENYCIQIQKPGQCLNSRMWPGGKNQRCIQISQTCQSFVKETGECTSCFSPYILVTPGVCGYNSITCQQGFAFLSIGRCVPAINNCKTYSQITGKCLTCQIGYFIIPQSGICESISS